MWKPKTLKQYLIRATVNAVAGTAMIGAAMFMAGQSNNADIAPLPEDGQQVQVHQSKEDRLLETKCRDYAEGTIPGHAVVTLPGKEAVYTSSDVAFALWGADQKPGTSDDLAGQATFCR